jgi:hypothetical protein
VVREAINTEMKVWGKMIANADITDPLIFGRQISAYSALWKYMKDEPEMIAMISKVLPPSKYSYTGPSRNRLGLSAELLTGCQERI